MRLIIPSLKSFYYSSWKNYDTTEKKFRIDLQGWILHTLFKYSLNLPDYIHLITNLQIRTFEMA